MDCHLGLYAADLPDMGPCCAGSAMFGPDRCTCWREVYDLDQQPPRTDLLALLAAGIQPNTRPMMCADCAYRPGSPEKVGADGYAGDAEFLESIAASGERFWCHQGIRRPIKLVHPSGAEIPAHAGAYDPPKHAGIPLRADGTPAELCAGWAARRRALVAREAADVAGLLTRHRFVAPDEYALHAAIADILDGAGILFRREVSLSARDRIDFLTAFRVGIEVKAAGQPARVLAQLGRYAASPEVDALILVTTRATHRGLPDTVGEKPLRVVPIGGAG